MKLETKKIKGEDKEFVVQTFDGMNDMLKYIEDNDWKQYENLTKHIKREQSFFDCKNFEEALHELKFGKTSMTAKYMKELKDDAKIKGEALHQSFALAEQGTIYDIGAVISGLPECCLEDMPLPQIKKKITIYLDMGYPGYIDAEYINNRGIALYNFISTLVRQNYIVDVYLFTSTEYHNNDQNGIQLTRVTNINNRPLLPHLAFGCTTSYFRAITWMCMQIPFKDITGDKTWDSARSSVPRTMRDEFAKQNIFYIGGGYTNNNFESCSIEQAEKEIIRLFEGFKEGKDLNGGRY